MERILIVDDDQESRDLLGEVLESNGYFTHAVADAKAAHEILNLDGGFSIVIADLRMPQESGLELLRKLREQNSGQEVILMSAFMSGSEKKEAIHLGARALLDKPFQLAELLRTVAEVVAGNSIGFSSQAGSPGPLPISK